LTHSSSNVSRIAIERIVRDGWGRVLSVLPRGIRDFELAEDVLAEAVLMAIERWRSNENYSARRVPLETLADLEQADQIQDPDEMIPDERLCLIFTCCHHAIAEGALPDL
jgi:RNA polymerase sigma-70 factor (ECF subfamily)